jgi:NAD-dependent SIR2 family protein deacetylase
MDEDECVVYGEWQVRSVCSGCGENIESPSFGDEWFTNQKYPVCPKCGAYSPFVGKTMRTVGTWVKDDGFWGKFFGHWVTNWEEK